MNNNYLNNTTFPNNQIYSNNITNIQNEQPYIENILKANRGKKVSIYQSFTRATEKDKVFTGIIEQSGKDYIILSDPSTGNWYLLWSIYVDFIKFDEEINIVNKFYT